METLLKEINELIARKNEEIAVLRWENDLLTRQNTELKNDIEKYKENEVNIK